MTSSGVEIYNYINASALNAGVQVGIQLDVLLRQSKKLAYLPANALYIQNLDANATIFVYMNDLSGSVYAVEPQKDKFITGVNVWNVIVKNVDGSNNIAASEILISFFKTGIFTGVD